MNVKLTMAFGAVLAAASTSFAQATEYQDFSSFVSTKSRAEVIAELHAARGNDSLQVLDGTYPMIARNASAQRERQAVVAEQKRFHAEHPNFNAELDYPAVFQSAPMRQRMVSADTSSTIR